MKYIYIYILYTVYALLYSRAAAGSHQQEFKTNKRADKGQEMMTTRDSTVYAAGGLLDTSLHGTTDTVGGGALI